MKKIRRKIKKKKDNGRRKKEKEETGRLKIYLLLRVFLQEFS